jgi:hypothetical protein
MEIYVRFRVINVFCGSRSDKLPLNHSVLFVQEKDLILNSDYWKIIVNFDLMPYDDVITTQLKTYGS